MEYLDQPEPKCPDCMAILDPDDVHLEDDCNGRAEAMARDEARLEEAWWRMMARAAAATEAAARSWKAQIE